MRQLFSILALILICTVVHAQTATDDIKMTINNLFTAMRNSDSTALKECFTPGAMLQTVTKDKEGNLNVQTIPITSFATRIATLPKNAADERIVYDMIKVDLQLASVWTPYRFYYQQQFSHCGVNSFQLVKLAGGWKIQYVIDTRRKDACIETTAGN
jgi:hypothetical protein